MMMALTQENVHYTLNSDPGIMNKSNRIHARIQEFLSGGRGGGGGGGGGGGVEARWPENSLDNVVFSHQLILQFAEGIQWFYYRGEEGVQLLPGGGMSKETDITCDFPGGGGGGGGGGPDPLTPLWIHMWGRLTPLFAYRIMVYQNLNKTEKYHPKTTKRKKAIWVSIGYKQLDPPPPWKELDPSPPSPWKMLDPLWNLEKIIAFFEINHLTSVK